jgi:hypothetical protein
MSRKQSRQERSTFLDRPTATWPCQRAVLQEGFCEYRCIQLKRCDAEKKDWTTPKGHPTAHSAPELVVSIYC